MRHGDFSIFKMAAFRVGYQNVEISTDGGFRQRHRCNGVPLDAFGKMIGNMEIWKCENRPMAISKWGPSSIWVLVTGIFNVG